MSGRDDANDTPRLSEHEWEVMKPLWERGPMAARDIFAAIPEQQGWAYNTVKTMLARLVKKGAVAYDQIGNSYLYRPVHSRTEMTQAATGTFIRRVFDGALNPFVAHFAQHATAEELRQLRKELEQVERERIQNGEDG
jgi:BlaI family transcriptional regulator, penicillinase repressor